MLVLTRKRGESIVIGDKTEVHVIAVNGQKVRLGIEAPKDIAIDRKEIHVLKREGTSSK